MNQYQYLDADFAAENGQLGCIGYMEEQRYRALRVQVGDVLAAYPDAVFHCAVLRAGEKHPYRVPDDALAVENGVLIVPLGKAEYACPGLMEMQISFDAGNVSGRSVLYQAVVGKSLVSDAGDPQSPYADALRDMDAAIARMDAFVAAGGQVPEESIRQAVTAYLAENPVEEKDPTVPAWAKEAEKPGYTADEVGAIAREGRNVQNANIAFGAVTTGILADKAVTAAKIADGVIPAAYTLPVATAQTLGGVKPVAKTEDMTQSVGVDALGGLWALPGGGSSEPEGFELIDTIDWSDADMAMTNARRDYTLDNVREVVIYWTGISNTSTSNSTINLELNGFVCIAAKSGKEGTTLNGYSVYRVLEGVGIMGYVSGGATLSTNYSADGTGGYNYNLYPTDQLITTLTIRNPPTQYYATAGITKIYVR